MATEQSKIVANMLLEEFGGRPEVYKYWNENESECISIFSVEDKNNKGDFNYSTIGLSDYDIDKQIKGKDLGVELLIRGEEYYEEVANILSTCAFNIISDNHPITYGTVFKDVVKMYYPQSEMNHVIMVLPIMTENMDIKDVKDNKVGWLQALPISDNEYKYLLEYGVDYLEKLLEENRANINDIFRESTI